MGFAHEASGPGLLVGAFLGTAFVFGLLGCALGLLACVAPAVLPVLRAAFLLGLFGHVSQLFPQFLCEHGEELG